MCNFLPAGIIESEQVAHQLMASNCFFFFLLFFFFCRVGEYRSRFEVQKIIFFFLVCWGEEIPPKGQFVRKWMVKKKNSRKFAGTFSCVWLSFGLRSIWTSKTQKNCVCLLFYSLNWNGYQVEQVIHFVAYLSFFE